jgi:hypothetical protein
MASTEVQTLRRNSHGDFLRKATLEKNQNGLCAHGRFLVQQLLTRWLHYAPGEEPDVLKRFNDFGGEQAVGVSWGFIKRNADEGLKGIGKGKSLRGTWLTLESAESLGCQTMSFRSTQR